MQFTVSKCRSSVNTSVCGTAFQAMLLVVEHQKKKKYLRYKYGIWCYEAYAFLDLEHCPRAQLQPKCFSLGCVGKGQSLGLCHCWQNPPSFPVMTIRDKNALHLGHKRCLLFSMTTAIPSFLAQASQEKGRDTDGNTT